MDGGVGGVVSGSFRKETSGETWMSSFVVGKLAVISRLHNFYCFLVLREI